MWLPQTSGPAWAPAGLWRTTSQPLPVGGGLQRLSSTPASLVAADAGLAGSPLAYTGAGSHSAEGSADPEAGGGGIFGSRRGSAGQGSHQGFGAGSWRLRHSLSYGALDGSASGRGAGAGGQALEPGRDSAGGGEASTVHAAPRGAPGTPDAHEGAPTWASTHAKQGPHSQPSEPAPAEAAASGLHTLSSSMLRTVTERSDELPEDVAAKASLLSPGGSLNGLGDKYAHMNGGAAAGGGGSPAKSSAPDASSEDFAEKRQVPLGKFSVLVLLFAGAPRVGCLVPAMRLFPLQRLVPMCTRLACECHHLTCTHTRAPSLPGLLTLKLILP